MKLSDERHSELEKYVISMSIIMQFGHYTIQVDDEYEEKEHVAACTYVNAESVDMRIAFAECFFDFTPEKQRQVVCHELLHAPMEPLFQMGFNSAVIQDQVATTTFALLGEQGKVLIERTVDFLASGWALLLPLPTPFPQ